ncbi:hypothetical protein OF83DRAFT_1172384 [Amylostereum chailletii]|nr:hypothetical protein OF83DRAFT_1172384 [Amylostereum chailletii]
MSSYKELAQNTLQSNREHQYAVKVYSERLEAELEAVDKLIDAAEVDEDEESSLHLAGALHIEGAERPMGLLTGAELILENSPFHHDAARRQRYINLTEIHPMRPKELDCLADAVRMENYRLRAYDAQRRGLPPFPPPSEVDQELEKNTVGIDWERVASKVAAESNSVTVERSAKECEIRWLGDRHPRFNRSPWAPEELSRAKVLVEGLSEGDVDWVDVAVKLGTNRTPMDVMRQTVVRKVHIWDAESDKRLLDAVSVYGIENWPLVARMVSEDATPSACQNRYCRSLDPSLMKGGWTEEEDKKLRLAVAVWGNSWVDVASVMAGRTNEQCRDRYTDKLNPTIIRGKWTTSEDANLRAAVEEIGEGKWKKISQKLASGRTDNMCRQRYEVIRRIDAEDEATKPSTSVVKAARPRSSKATTSTGNSRSKTAQSRKRKKEPTSDSDSSEADEPNGVTETSDSAYRSAGSTTAVVGPSGTVRPRPTRRKAAAAGVVTETEASERHHDQPGIIASSSATCPPRPRPRPRKVVANPARASSSASPSTISLDRNNLSINEKGREPPSINASQTFGTMLGVESEGEDQHLAENIRKGQRKTPRKLVPSGNSGSKQAPSVKKRKSQKQRDITITARETAPSDDATPNVTVGVQEGLSSANAQELPQSVTQNSMPHDSTEADSRRDTYVGSRRKQPSRAARNRTRIAQDDA